MSGAPERDEHGGVARLRAHESACVECRASPVNIESAAAAFDDGQVPLEPRALSRRVMAAAAPLLASHARRAYRRRLVRSLLLTLAPLPAVVAFDAYFLREAYRVLSAWMPGPVVAWVLAGYAMTLLLLCALTYAALPLLFGRARTEARGWTV